MRAIRFIGILLLLISVAGAQGPDVIVGSVNGMSSYGNSGGIHGYAVGTTSCNIGTTNLNFYGSTNQHPVIAQNIYRLKNGRFEQIGMSWVKHAFASSTGSLCGACQNPGSSQLLGVGCSDPYGSSTNGNQSILGPRNEINASTGYFPYPFGSSYPAAAATIGRRVQCLAADVNPTLNAGATYYAEGHYVSPDDAAAGNKNNNASWRQLTFANDANFTAALTGNTSQQQPGILAWQSADPSVVISYVDVPNDGRFIIAKKVTSLGGGNNHIEFVIQNLNSDRSGRGFTVNFPAGTVISTAGFRDIAYHSGEPYSGTDWGITINGPNLSWATDLHIVNQNANALRWGTAYNFWCNATAAAESNTSIELYKAPPCPADPVVPASSGYLFDNAAPFDDPTLTTPVTGPSGDDISVVVPIGFSFNFYGTNHTALNFSTNGFFSFTSTSSVPANACIPSSSTPNAVIAGYWDDLFPPLGSGLITYQMIGTAPNRRFVASWSNVPLFSNSSSLQSFKIILDETTNKITSTIISCAGGGSSATRGIENQAGSAGVQGSCNAAGSAPALTSWTWTPYNAILPSADLEVTGSTGPGGTLTWSLNSNGIGAPVILVASTDPGPTSLGTLGTVNIGFMPGSYVVLADGLGAFQPANPADFTDACGDYALSIPLGPGGLPPGLTIYNQGVVISPSSNPPPPNGSFHITDMETINT